MPTNYELPSLALLPIPPTSAHYFRAYMRLFTMRTVKRPLSDARSQTIAAIVDGEGSGL